MINKKSLLGAGAIVMMLASSGLSLAGCGGTAAADLTYWCPSLDNTIMEEFVSDFKTAYPDYAGKNIELLANFAENETYSNLHKDLGAAADVILMVDDNIRAGVKAEELQAYSDADKAAAILSDGQDAVDSLSIGDKLYALPYRNDNAPMMLYDKTLFTDSTKLNKIEDVLQVCKDAGKKFYLDIGNGWYNPFMLWAGGGKFTVVDGVLTTNVSRIDAVATSCQAVYDLYGKYKDTWVSNSTTGTIEAGFKSKEIGVAFMWNDLSVINHDNANITVTSWPTMKVGTADVQLGCFQSYKGIVIKAELSEEKLTLATAFAKFLANADCQTKRLAQLSYGPSNLVVGATEAAKAIPWTANIAKMNAAGLLTPQAPNTTDKFWTPMANFGALITDQKSWGDAGSAKNALKGLVGNDGWNTADLS